MSGIAAIFVQRDELQAELDALRKDAESCVDIFKDFDIDEIKTMSKSIQFAWASGEAITKENGK